MTPTTFTRRLRSAMTVTVLCSVYVAVFATDADAACFAPAGLRATGPVANARIALAAARPQAAQGARSGSLADSTASPVGLWHTLFLLGDGPVKYDESFQTIHSDGTEMMVSNGLPPALGNVCVGVWKRDGATITLKHTTWNWDSGGNFAGTFVMVVEFRLDHGGDRYEGTWSAVNFDPGGNHIPGLDAAGIVRAERVNVD